MLEPSQDTALSSSSPGLPQPCVRPISPPLVCRVVAGQGWNWAAGEGGEGAAPQDPPTRSPAQAGTETPLASEQIRQKLPCWLSRLVKLFQVPGYSFAAEFGLWSQFRRRSGEGVLPRCPCQKPEQQRGELCREKWLLQAWGGLNK